MSSQPDSLTAMQESNTVDQLEGGLDAEGEVFRSRLLTPTCGRLRQVRGRLAAV